MPPSLAVSGQTILPAADFIRFPPDPNLYAKSPACLLMKKTFIALSFLSSLAIPAAYATTATSLGSFGGIEEPSAIYHADGSVTQGDAYVNITDRGGGVFRFLLRYHKGDWSDGDRNSTSTTMQRAEVKVLGARQLPGETYTYASTFKTVSTYTFGTTSTCVVQQVKATDGDNNQALSGTNLTSQTAGHTAHGGVQGTMTTVKSFSWAAGSSLTVANKIKVSSAAGRADGSYQTSINGGSFSGVSNVVMERPSATQYQPKWGLYRSQGNLNIDRGTDEWVDHSNLTATKN
jgi:hypothetical protein